MNNDLITKFKWLCFIGNFDFPEIYWKEPQQFKKLRNSIPSKSYISSFIISVVAFFIIFNIVITSKVLIKHHTYNHIDFIFALMVALVLATTIKFMDAKATYSIFITKKGLYYNSNYYSYDKIAGFNLTQIKYQNQYYDWLIIHLKNNYVMLWGIDPHTSLDEIKNLLANHIAHDDTLTLNVSTHQ